MKHIVIVGGGISGLICAINCKNDNNKVTILEHNSEVGKKLLITGNGRCNFYNDDMTLDHFHSSTPELLEKFIGNHLSLGLDFIKNLGIEYKVKDGYYYPYTNNSRTIRDTLLYEVNNRDINILYDVEVNDIKKDNDGFIINDDIKCDIVVMATGGLSYKKTGSTGKGYDILSSFGHTVTPLLPGLVSLETDNKYDWKGVRTDAIVKLFINGDYVKEEKGELQLTSSGISGICVFNLSSYVSTALNENCNVNIEIDFLPRLNETLEDNIRKYSNLTIKERLNRLLNEKLVDVILSSSEVDKNKLVEDLTTKEMSRIIKHIKSFSVNISKLSDIDIAQVTIGGINLNEILSSNYESKIVQNLYIIGELLDIDGDCGGYNITFNMISALKSSEYIKRLQ